jgi:proline iminopeptidase
VTSGPGVARVTIAVLAPLLLACSCSSRAPTVQRSSTSAITIADARDSTVAGAGVTLHVHSVGSVTAPDTIITVHGGPGLSLETMSTYNELAGPGRRVISYDQRGSGRSTAPSDGEYGLTAQMADLEAVRVASGAATVDLIGESWGGMLAEAYTAAHPDRVRALVLVGAVPLDRDALVAGQRRFQTHIAELQTRGLIPRPLPAVVDDSCLAQLQAELPAYVADPRALPTLDPGTCTSSTSQATYGAFMADDALPDNAEALGAFRGRALVAMGDHDAFGLEWLDRNVALLRGATVTRLVVHDAGHLVVAEQTQQLLHAIDVLLTG